MSERALRLIAGQPWVIDPDAAEGLLALLDRDFDRRAAEAIEAAFGEPGVVNSRADRSPRANYAVTVRDGVAEIPVRGVIMRYANVMHSVCGGTSVQTLAADLADAVENPKVRAILLHFDTPGGQANGIAELASQIRAARQVKPVHGYAGGQCQSGGLWLGAACDTLSCAPTSFLGSVGAIGHYQPAKAKEGKTLRSRQSPNKAPDVHTPEGESAEQRALDSICSVFIAEVARGRGMTPEAVVEDWGGGASLMGQEAVDANMADGVSDFETVLSRLSRGLPAVDKPDRKPKPTPKPGKPAAEGKPKGTPMSLKSFLTSLLKSHPEAVASALAEGETLASVGAEAGVAALLTGASPAQAAVKTEEAIRAEVKAELKDKHAKELAVSLNATASAWYDGLVSAGKALPRDKAAAVARYVDAATADATHGPLSFTDAAGNASTATRLSAVVAPMEAAKPNGRTAESVPQNDPLAAAKLAGLSVLPESNDPATVEAAASAARVNAAMNATPEGKAALASAAK